MAEISETSLERIRYYEWRTFPLVLFYELIMSQNTATHKATHKARGTTHKKRCRRIRVFYELLHVNQHFTGIIL